MNGFARRELGLTRRIERGEHFMAVSFRLSWGELLASGSIGLQPPRARRTPRSKSILRLSGYAPRQGEALRPA